MAPRILIAGIGNIFFGDDAFGVEVARRLLAGPLAENVQVVDFGIRGFDLAYALTDGYDHVIMVDAMQRGKPPGTVYLIEPDLAEFTKPDSEAMMQTHGLHPGIVLRLASTLGGLCPWIRIVGCEPAELGTEEDPVMGLSEVVTVALDETLDVIAALVDGLSIAPSQL